MLKRLTLVTVGLLVTGLATAAPAFAAAPTVTALAPSSGPVNSLFVITGTGFTSASQVKVAGVITTRSVVSATKINARVPVGAGSGPVTVTTTDGTGTGPTFTVTPGVLLQPAVVRPSASTTVQASGFGANEAVDVYLDSTAVALVVADANGVVSRAVAPPLATTPGQHWITAIGRRSGNAAQAALTVRTDWNGPNFDAGHTGVNRFETQVTSANVDGLTQRWAVYYGAQAYAPPVVAGGMVVIHNYNDQVIAVDAATGTQVWMVDLSTSTSAFGAAVVANGIVYVGGGDGYLYALSLTTGAQQWRYNTGGPVSDNPAVGGGLVFVPSRGGAFYALDAATGAVRWGTSVGGGANFYSPTVVGPWVYVGASNGTMRRYDAASGGSGWQVTLDGATFAAPLVADSKVFATTLNGSVYALRAATGGVDWTASTGSGSVTGTPALVGSRLIVTNTQSVVTAYDYTSGAVLWSQSGANAGYSQVTSAAGVAYVSNSTRTFAYDVRTGAVLRTLTLGGNSGGTVITDGALYGYDYTETQLTRFDLAPDRAAVRPSVAALSARH